MRFLVLPDHPGAATVIGGIDLDDPGTRIVAHPSGKPWIVGRWHERDLLVATAGEVSVALLGAALIAPDELERRLRSITSPRDLDTLAGSMAGGHHFVASVAGTVRVQGSLSTAFQVHYATWHGVTVASNRAEPLVDLIGAGIDEERVALELLVPFGPPWPLNDRPPWRGVHVPQLGECLEIGPDGAGRTRRWWSPPPPHQRLGNGATIGQALVDAVTARTRGEDTVSTDLSGGVDSTTLTFLAARTGTRLVTSHFQADGRTTDDLAWARLSGRHLTGARHLVTSPQEAPDWYAQPDHAPLDREGPHVLARASAATDHLAALVAAEGSRRHLQGVGGDEMFQPGTMCLSSIARRRPLLALHHARALRARRRWSMRATAAVLGYSQSYADWLTGCATGTPDAARKLGAPAWEVSPTLPPWITADGAATIHRSLRAAAGSRPEPLSTLPVQHEMIRINCVNGRMLRRHSHLASAHGVTFHGPFTDDRVLEAALSIRLEDRMDPHRFKPALVTAMTGLVPGDILARTTKNEASAAMYAGMRNRREELVDLMADSRLARMGLIDPAAVRAVLRGAHATALTLMPLDATLACELWLRNTGEPALANPGGTPWA
ncbi:asparagine synthase-related protein [Saccharothrix sp. AJ9571]|nr:asparagine synthase-related protein [Saccharothrix sp. AJ9571]